MTNYQLWSTLIKYGISPNQLYFLDSYRHKIKPSSIINPIEERRVAIEKGYIDAENKLTQEALLVLDEFETYIVKTKKKVATEVLGENFMENINSYISLFPKQRLPSNQYARQPVRDVKDAFIWFFKNYPEYDWKTVLDAADYYVYMYKQKDYMYMMDCLAFIAKTDPITKKIKSTLATTCLEMAEQDQNNDE